MSEKEAEKLGLLNISASVTVTENNQGADPTDDVMPDDFDSKPSKIDPPPTEIRLHDEDEDEIYVDEPDESRPKKSREVPFCDSMVYPDYFDII